jgi:hypothetical protein
MGPVRRTVCLICALALIGAGLYLLCSILMYAESLSSRMITAAAVMTFLGSYWLWVDFIKATPERKG